MRQRPFRLFILPLLSLALLSLGLIAAAGAARADSAKTLIESFNNTLLSTMKSAKSLGYSGRYEKLAPAIESTFDLSFMAQYAAGRYWRKLDADQQKELVDAFSKLTIATYANRFDGFSGESFKVLSEETPRTDTRLVNSEIVKKDGEVVKLNYLTRDTPEGWRVIDIFLKGTISELATRRSEYSSTLGNQGFDGLMSIMKRKISGLETASN